ncbi:DUF3310 domain-containing protein [Finegoldia sp. P1-F-LS]|uniref:DUF3310 domain-containing protein n=1 Tax=unclassified Finegoldia TaxID=2619637 RepID=UPI00406CF656
MQENKDRYMINNENAMRTIILFSNINNCKVEDGFYLCNTLKYLIRYNDKNGLDDLLKAKDYLEMLICYLSNADEV